MFVEVVINGFERLATAGVLDFQRTFISSALPQALASNEWDMWLSQLRAQIVEHLKSPALLPSFNLHSIFCRGLGLSFSDFTETQRARLACSTTGQLNGLDGSASVRRQALPNHGNNNGGPSGGHNRNDRRASNNGNHNGDLGGGTYRNPPRRDPPTLLMPGREAKAARADFSNHKRTWTGVEEIDSKLHYRHEKFARGDACAVCGSSGCGHRRSPLDCRKRPRE
jgi:hypothetical protein